MAYDLKWAAQLRNELFLFSETPDFSEQDTADLFALLTLADDAYHNTGKPILTDEEYDAIRLYCETVDPDNTYFLGVGSKVRGAADVKLPYPMGSLTQAYVGGDMKKWIDQWNLEDEILAMMEKLDGFSTLIVYGNDGNLQIAFSRGDGIEGQDITRHVAKFKNVPKNVGGPLAVRAEIIFSKANWNTIKDVIKRSDGSLYKNARNATSGILNSSDGNQIAYQHLSVVAYEILGKDMDKRKQLEVLKLSGFTIPAFVAWEGWECTESQLTDVLNAMRTKSNFEIDGIVIDVDSANLRKKINPSKSTLNPEYARKFKVADASNLAVSEVVEVQWNISKNGYLKPRVKIKPVDLVGVTVQHATGFNAKFIVDNNIGPGAKIRITRSGDVIPFILGVVEPADKPQLPEELTTWTTTGVDLVLVNVNDNDTVKVEQMIDFFAKVGVEYLGEGNIQTMFDSGFKTIVDLINLSEFEWTSIIGANGKKIHKSIREKLKNVPWYVVAGAHPAFGRGVGVRKMKKLYDAFAGDMKKLGDVQSILAVEGFEHKTAMKITTGFLQFIEFLTDTDATIIFAAYEAPVQGNLSGSTFLFTGFRDKNLEQKIVSLGGKMSSSVSSKLTYLVAADPSETSGKLTKAREVGTKIISRDELTAMLGE